MLSHIEPQNINLNSFYATTKNEYGNRCEFQLAKPIIIPNNVNCYVRLNHFKYTNIFYNVPSSKNVFYYSFDGGLTINQIVVTAGNYNITTLITALSSNGFSFTYSKTTFKLTIANTSSFILLNGENDISKILGYISFSTPVTSYTCKNAVNLLGTQNINIQLQGINLSTIIITNGIPQILESIPINILSGNSFSYAPTNLSEFRVNNIAVSNIFVNLLDENGADLDFLGSTFFLSLHIRFLYPNEVRIEQSLADKTNIDINNLEEQEK